MGLRFTVLASGSGGNATLIESDDFGLLIDAGLGPRILASRLAAIGRSWAAVKAVTAVGAEGVPGAILPRVAAAAVPSSVDFLPARAACRSETTAGAAGAAAGVAVAVTSQRTESSFVPVTVSR